MMKLYTIYILRLPLAIALVLSSLFIACHDEHAPAFTIATNVWPGYEPLYIAREKNYFDNEKVQLIEMTSASEVIRAFKNGTIDAAALTMDEVLILRDLDIDLSVILITDISHGADAILGQPEIKSFADIKGKRVGFENTALGSYILSRSLDIFGLKKGDIQLISAEANEHERVFVEKKVDVVVTFEPTITKLVNQGANILFDSKQIPNEVVDVIIVRTDFLKKEHKFLEEFLSAWFEAVDFFKTNPDQAAAIMQGRLKTSKADILKSFEGLILPSRARNFKLLDVNNKESLLPSIKKLRDLMYENQLVRERVRLDGLLNNSVIGGVE